MITYRIPSAKVKFGYIEVTVNDLSELPEPEALAQHYADYMVRYAQAETGEVAAQQKVLDDKAALELLNSELGVTKLSEEEAAKPWNQETETEKKPWESGEKQPEAAASNDSDWDF